MMLLPPTGPQSRYENPSIAPPTQRVTVVFDTVTAILPTESFPETFVIVVRGMASPTRNTVLIKLSVDDCRRNLSLIRDGFDGLETSPILFVQPLLV